ncbi:hypothetical protein C0J52_17268 [Blattella germanica]|nr:hypothetical protein C0J52_17268 [Blattella germanica]
MFGGGSFPRRSTGFLVRPRLGGSLRNYLRPTEVTRPPRKPRTRKAGGPHKMELRKRTPDYTDIAYREAVARLRYLLAESYSPHSSPAKSSQIHRGDDSGDEIESVALSERSRHQHHHHFLPSYRVPLYGSKRTLFADPPAKLTHTHSIQNLPAEATDTTTKPEGPMPPPELMAFIERQEEYIEQLEKESQYCRDELSALLGKVKEVISENEGLHEREKAGLLKSVFDCFEDEDDQEMDSDGKQSKKKRLEGPSIVFESRISELEAQLTQTKMDLRKALEEAELYKKKLSDQPLGFETSGGMSGDCSSHRQQIENLQREKDELHENVVKLQAALSQFREKEADATLKVKRSLDVVDQAHFEKAQVGVENEEQTVESDVAKVGKEKNEVGEESAREQKTQEEKQPTSEELVVTEAQADIEVAHLDVMGGMPVELEVTKRKCKVTARTRRLNVPVQDLSEYKMKLMNLEMKNAKLTEEKLKLEILVNKNRLEYYHKKNATNKTVAKKSKKEKESTSKQKSIAEINQLTKKIKEEKRRRKYCGADYTCCSRHKAYFKAELEVRRLKEELDRQHEKMRELMQEQGRKVQDERLQLERRYTQQMEQLSTDLTSQWDSSSKLQLELEKQRRVEADLRRDLQQKTVTIEELKKELQNKISSLQTELVQAAVERGSLEQELAASRLAIERAERDGRQEISRLQAEVAALRQRLDRADADVMHSRRENLRLTEQIASLEREVLKLRSFVALYTEYTDTWACWVNFERDLLVHTVAELEGMIQSQNQVMEKLKQECHSLTEKLEESSTRHKRERVSLRQENVMLMDKLERLWEVQKQVVVSNMYRFVCRQEMAGLQSNIDFLSNKLEASFEAQEWKEDDAYARDPAEAGQYEQYDPNEQGYEHNAQYQHDPSGQQYQQESSQLQQQYEPTAEQQQQQYQADPSQSQQQYRPESRLSQLPQSDSIQSQQYQAESSQQQQQYQSESSQPQQQYQSESSQPQQQYQPESSQPQQQSQPENTQPQQYEPEPTTPQQYQSEPGQSELGEGVKAETSPAPPQPQSSEA